MDRKTIMEKAICFYGDDIQKDVAIEELAELTQQIIKDKRGIYSKDKMIEEMADVRIMIDQLMLMHDIAEAELDKEIEYKLTRLNGAMSDADN